LRAAFSEAMLQLARQHPELLLLSGDVGFRAFEGLADELGPRFINTGVAEQMAVGLAAGLAHRGHKVFWYSIASFAVFRPLEQIRLDVCLHNLPVFIVGNGGGYGYGAMGATHHALDDLACLSGLPNMTCYVPAYQADVPMALNSLLQAGQPAYLRLGLGPEGQPQPLTSLQRIQSGGRLTAVALGPMLHEVLQAAAGHDVEVWAARILPFDDSLGQLLQSLRRTRRLLVVEEHSRRGGLAEALSLALLEHGLRLKAMKACCAQGYPQGLYGSQSYHRSLSGLDAASLTKEIQGMLA
jgi:transketolase